MAVLVWLPVALLAIWWVLSANSTSPFFPPLSTILTQLWDNWVLGDAKLELVPSLSHLVYGFALGGGLGLISGTVLWKFSSARRAASPFVYFLYALPAPALLPALIAIFGIGETRQVALIAFGAIWPTLLNTLDGMRGIDQVKFDSARAMRLGPWRTLFELVIPAASPQIVAGLRASLQVSIILMVVSELIAAQSGIGYFILQAQTVFSITLMWTGILVLALVGTILNLIFVLIERRLLRWHIGYTAIGGSAR
ncbi:ABC transporter permease [Nocardioides sp. NPDC051685]|uniref:ABC transporter permease n=1 Tax=Nocardioides sp. NPDC051685 TaxID=3364334 RepID=UPI0037892B5D